MQIKASRWHPVELVNTACKEIEILWDANKKWSNEYLLLAGLIKECLPVLVNHKERLHWFAREHVEHYEKK